MDMVNSAETANSFPQEDVNVWDIIPESVKTRCREESGNKKMHTMNEEEAEAFIQKIQDKIIASIREGRPWTW